MPFFQRGGEGGREGGREGGKEGGREGVVIVVVSWDTRWRSSGDLWRWLGVLLVCPVVVVYFLLLKNW
jgi:hypothetical protein